MAAQLNSILVQSCPISIVCKLQVVYLRLVTQISIITFGELDMVLCLALRYFFPPPSCERNILIGQIYLAHLIPLHSSSSVSYTHLTLPTNREV